MALQDIISIIGIYIAISFFIIFNFVAVFYLNDVLIKRKYYETHRTIRLKFLSKKCHELFLLPFVILLFNILLILVSVILLIIIIITKNDLIGAVYILILLIYTLIVSLIDYHYKKR